MSFRFAPTFLALSSLLVVSAGARIASAQGDGATDRPPAASLPRSAGSGGLLAFTSGASVEGQRAIGSAFGGYDSTRKSGLFEAAAEARIWKGLSLRGGALYSGSSDTLRPSFGARYQFLTEGGQGIDGSLGVFYRPEGLTEPEGEIETVLSAGSHLGQTYLLANLVYGQDPEANERDGEVRIAALHPVGSMVFLGLDGRVRFDLGSKATKLEAKLDAVAGPVATVLVGPVALVAQGGVSALRLKDSTSYGAVVLGGLGSSF
ncbi:MAG TPA: hypothetical protein VN914_09415 [Polyangia bacterium]|nr:hypothetical protein [Polyangia bacterium]